MFTSLEADHFKAFESLNLDLKLITVFIGPNGSGKSSAIQALILPKQSLNLQMRGARPALEADGDFLQLGGFSALARRGGPGFFTLAYGGRFVPPVKSLEDTYVKEIEYRYWSRFIQNVPTEVQLKASLRGIIGRRSIEHEFSGRYEQSTGPVECTRMGWDGSEVALRIVRGFGSPLEGAGGRQSSAQPYAAVSRFADEVIRAIPQHFNHVFLVPSGRGVDLPEYELGRDVSKEFSTVSGSIEQARALLTTLHIEQHLEEKVAEWFEEALDVRIRTRVRPNFRVALEVTSKNSRSFDNAVNHGYGYTPLVFLLTQIALAPQGATICVEEPEIHLHPRAQSDATAVMVRESKRENKQLIMATHSEHILVKLLNMIAKGELDAGDLAVYYFEKGSDNVARAEQLPVSQGGSIEGGLKGFFEQHLAEIEDFLRSTGH